MEALLGYSSYLTILIDRILVYCTRCNRPLKIAKKMLLKRFYSHQRCARRNTGFPFHFTQPLYPGVEAGQALAWSGGARCPVLGRAGYTGGAE